jgi:hypothetical protein
MKVYPPTIGLYKTKRALHPGNTLIKWPFFDYLLSIIQEKSLGVNPVRILG